MVFRATGVKLCRTSIGIMESSRVRIPHINSVSDALAAGKQILSDQLDHLYFSASSWFAVNLLYEKISSPALFFGFDLEAVLEVSGFGPPRRVAHMTPRGAKPSPRCIALEQKEVNVGGLLTAVQVIEGHLLISKPVWKSGGESRNAAGCELISNDPCSAPILRYHRLGVSDDRVGVTLEKSCDRRCRKLGPFRQNVR